MHITARNSPPQLQSARFGQIVVSGLALLAFIDGLGVAPLLVRVIAAAGLAAAAGAVAARLPVTAPASAEPPGADQLETTLAEMNQMNAELMLLRDQAEAYALTDQLTGVGNRRAFQDALDAALARPPEPDKTLAVMIVDIDHFKAVNDTHGHARGDAALCELAVRLLAGARASDVVARWGGEEFVVLLPGFPPDQATLGRRAEVVRRAVARTPLSADGVDIQLTVSVGAALCTPRLADPEQLLQAADVALYAAKRGGRNMVVVHNDGTPATAAAWHVPGTGR